MIALLISFLLVSFWLDDARVNRVRDAEIVAKLVELKTIHAADPADSADTETYPSRAIRNAAKAQADLVDVWRADPATRRLYDWRRVQGVREVRPSVGWPDRNDSYSVFDLQEQDFRGRAAQTIASHPHLGDLLIRVTRPDIPLIQRFTTKFRTMAPWLVVWFGLAWLANLWLTTRLLAPFRFLASRALTLKDMKTGSRLPVVDMGKELEELSGAFNKLLDRNDQRSRRLLKFASEAAHELRTPLTAQRIVGELSFRDNTNSLQLRETISTMLEEADHMSRVIDGLLLIAQAENNRLPMTIGEVDLVELATDCVELIKPLAELHGCPIRFVSLDDPKTDPIDRIAADASLVRQAILNLVQNAIVHNPVGTAIEVRLHGDSDFTSIVIQDSGTGFKCSDDDQTIKRGRLRKADPSDPPVERRLGMGLTIARALIRTQGGQLDVVSSLTVGTTATIRFPSKRRIATGRLFHPDDSPSTLIYQHQAG